MILLLGRIERTFAALWSRDREAFRKNCRAQSGIRWSGGTPVLQLGVIVRVQTLEFEPGAF